MKLAKCLKITKTKKFDVFVYPKGHIKYKRGIDEVGTDSFEVERDQNELVATLCLSVGSAVVS